MAASARLAPVALFAYKRPEHLRRCLDALKSNPEAAQTNLIVFADGPRHESDASAVSEVRELISQISGFAGVELHFRETNVGLARSIIDGVTHVVAKYGRAIVLEDDLVIAPSFLRYMNDALDLYERDLQVASIHGYVYPVAETLPETFFLRGADCWGWATWQRAWREFEFDSTKLLRQIVERRLEHQFDLDDSYPFTQMLRDQIAGNNDSWAVRWHASTFLKEMKTLYPGRSLVRNIGNDASGTHMNDTALYDVRFASAPVNVERIEIDENLAARASVAAFLQSGRRPLKRTWRSRMRSLLGWK